MNRGSARHRQDRVARFISLEANKDLYKMWKEFAEDRARHSFPQAPTVVVERIGESIAYRRSRFQYLKRHKMKKKLPESSRQRASISPTSGMQAATEADVAPVKILQQITAAHLQQVMDRSVFNEGTVLSKTVTTRYEAPERAESGISTTMVAGRLPAIPKFTGDGTSFECPFCCMICPVEEVGTESHWMSHLIRDLEPYFCIFPSCSSPFNNGESYTSWAAHIREDHMAPKWCCWYCQTADAPAKQFFSEGALDDHLKTNHDETNDGIRSSIVKHSKLAGKSALDDCPFCGCYPEEIEQKFLGRDNDKAADALAQHIRDHFYSIALLMLPMNYDTKSQKESNSLKSEADRGDELYRDTNGFDVLIGRQTAESLQCGRSECDCKRPASFFSGDWSRFSETVALERENAICDNFDAPYFKAMPKDGEWSCCLPPSTHPAIEEDMTLRSYFGTEVFDEAKRQLDPNPTYSEERSEFFSNAENVRQKVETTASTVSSLPDGQALVGLNIGRAHGVVEGDCFALYRADTAFTHIVDFNSSLATVKVISVDEFVSMSVLGRSTDKVQSGCKAIKLRDIFRLFVLSPRSAILITDGSEIPKPMMQELQDNIEAKGKLVYFSESDSSFFRINLGSSGDFEVSFTYEDQKATLTAESMNTLLSYLSHLAIYYNLLDLGNYGTLSGISASFFGSEPRVPGPSELAKSDRLDVPDHGVVSIEIRNSTDTDIYFVVLDLEQLWSVHTLVPKEETSEILHAHSNRLIKIRVLMPTKSMGTVEPEGFETFLVLATTSNQYNFPQETLPILEKTMSWKSPPLLKQAHGEGGIAMAAENWYIQRLDVRIINENVVGS